MPVKKPEPKISGGGITVMQVFQVMGITPSRSDSWAVGARCARQYLNDYGTWPRKENRPKTTGAGSHCFAIYPKSWQSRIANMIKRVCGEAHQSPQLF